MTDCNSGLLDIIFCARDTTAAAFEAIGTGAGTDCLGGMEVTDCNSGLLDIIFWARETPEAAGVAVEGTGVLDGGMAKASSASFSVTR